MVDYPDRNADDFDDLEKILYIHENAGSWRWFAPVGCAVNANDYSVGESGFPGPDTKHLAMTEPVPAVETDLDAIDFDDDVGSVTFGSHCAVYYSAPITVAWDLDGNGTYETTGSSVSFSAARLDGPTTRSIKARGQHPTDPTVLGDGVPVATQVRVRNVAPVIQSGALFDSTGNQIGVDVPFTLPGSSVTARVTFSDPGYDDSQTARLDWQDGPVDTSFATFSDARFGALGLLQHAHTYNAPGNYVVRPTVTDDDGGVANASLPVKVLSAEGALQATIEMLDALIGATTDPKRRNALQSARDEIAGNNGGQASNGALSKLQTGNLVAAIVKIDAAISDIEKAEKAGAGDLSTLKDLLGMTAGAIATSAYQKAKTALSPPSPAQQEQLNTIAKLLADGYAHLGPGRYHDACDAFRQATAKAQTLT